MDELAVHRAMMRPETYPGDEGPIDFTETHVSRLYFTPHHVYKIKKAVDFGFLNFTSLDRRRFYCEEEVRLNRRFAPETYLGVVEIRRTGSAIQVGGAGELVDYAVWMKRLPASQMLDRRIALGDPALAQEMVRLGRRLAELHRQSPVCRGDGGQSNLETIRLNWRENFRQIAPFAGRTIQPRTLGLLTSWVNRQLEQEAGLLQRREDDGFVRDAHGDLHAEHVCLTEPIQIYDCIEFNRRFRVADIAADLAFLLMDLDFRDRRDLSRKLLDAWLPPGGEGGGLPVLLPFYKVYRAFVRGKVDSFLAGEATEQPETATEAASRAKAYFRLALGYLSPRMLILTCGLMGVGKSTVGRSLARATGGVQLRSDLIRKELAGAGATGRDAPFGGGMYAAEFTRRTYAAMLERSREELAAGRIVIVDASFGRRLDRQQFRQLAATLGVPALTVAVDCPRETALARLDRRQATGTDPSDGRRQLYDSQSAAFEPVGPEEESILIDTSLDLDYNVEILLCHMIESGGIC